MPLHTELKILLVSVLQICRTYGADCPKPSEFFAFFAVMNLRPSAQSAENLSSLRLRLFAFYQCFPKRTSSGHCVFTISFLYPSKVAPSYQRCLYTSPKSFPASDHSSNRNHPAYLSFHIPDE